MRWYISQVVESCRKRRKEVNKKVSREEYL